VGDGAGYGVDTVIVSERTAVAGDVGQLVDEGVVAVLGSGVIPQEAMAALDVIAQLNRVDIASYQSRAARYSGSQVFPDCH
jgi:hypothetical protein